MELDIYLPDLNLAFEYQGQQHFHPVEAWGGARALDLLRARDHLKAKICAKREVRLVLVDYTEPLTEEHIVIRVREIAPEVLAG